MTKGLSTSHALTLDVKSQQAALNKLWAGLMLEELARLGVKHICIAPGSRSTPLTLAAADNRKLTIHTHFDERGLGFLALGLAKATQEPVAVVVTSGTAVANLLPAVAEAGLTGEKLVLLTSDRPLELIQCGANQAIRQSGIFSQHVTAFHDIPSPTLAVSPAWLLTTIDEAMQQQKLQGSAVHFNCHYPEPLYGEVADFAEYLSPLATWQGDTQPYTIHSQAAGNHISIDAHKWQPLTDRKGIVIAGRLEPEALPAVKALAERLGWPLLVDPQGGGSSDWAGFDVWLQNSECQNFLKQADTIVQFGARLVSKRLLQLIDNHDLQQYWLVDPLAGRLDPTHRRSVRIQAKIKPWAMLAAELTLASAHFGWAAPLQFASSRYIDMLSGHSSELTELTLAANLARWLPDTTELFLGNSLIVRLLDMCGKLPQTATFANRGASGIDGLIATAAGVYKARQAPLLCLLGDTSLLYDLNSLALLREVSHPVVVLVTNNDGGGIFDLLPVPEQQREDLYRMPHGLEFSHAAAMFGFNYHCPDSLEQAEQMCRQALSHSGTTLIEVKTPSGQAGRRLKRLFGEVRDAALL
ncbi:2-succinyl-5-enolpyruvyl-6-hydroxy-3-cyclohexene-1-carboxylic-acid synthase [Photobacterium lipolyticum]|uniref:2-succinyl-5-enolpyruvyl-6-hydroxy-3-cyclohexene-1-carboxylate synthase n=1 Tax=Photobacterium lipolyticum TaxID=266810 RepID=A0A2T3MVB9_9GAMM|nr:2-succinyl-5-enolpyruvyl-6-hydroxy-3-cyclohexene-1-carboxylic-acid synthase [Photobacterium lipolyticum]PSW03920.1 2-succinyl-5-enolpyruvyl-6-hydroxy-3-cyclohexene-1-carboxylic-acid synthase [Photobacterium lipolyticum]